MNEWDGPGVGWRKLRPDESVGGREYVAHGNLENPYDSVHTFSTWVREELVPPLPTEVDTLILARWANGQEARMVRTSHGWVLLGYDADLRTVTGFEVLARPVGKVLAEDEDVYYDSDDVRTITETVRREAAKAVLDKVRKHGFITDGYLDHLAREFKVESSS